MTTTQKLETLKHWQAAIEKSDALINPVIEVLKLAPESTPTEAVWGLQAELTTMASKLVGDAGGWLEWHWCENAMGAKGHEAGPTGAMLPIRTLEDLLWVIGVEA